MAAPFGEKSDQPNPAIFTPRILRLLGTHTSTLVHVLITRLCFTRWTQSHQLLVDYGLSQDDLQDAVRSSRIHLR